MLCLYRVACTSRASIQSPVVLLILESSQDLYGQVQYQVSVNRLHAVHPTQIVASRSHSPSSGWRYQPKPAPANDLRDWVRNYKQAAAFEGHCLTNRPIAGIRTRAPIHAARDVRHLDSGSIQAFHSTANG